MLVWVLSAPLQLGASTKLASVINVTLYGCVWTRVNARSGQPLATAVADANRLELSDAVEEVSAEPETAPNQAIIHSRGADLQTDILRRRLISNLRFLSQKRFSAVSSQC
jgi:hypothetical protein